MTTLDEQAPRMTTLDELAPRTRHLEMTEEELDAYYPRLQAPPDEPLHDVACDEDDLVYQHGLQMQIAEALQEDADKHGRLRHGHAEGPLLGDGAAAASLEGCLLGAAASADGRQASYATVARRHGLRRSAKGGPA